MNGTAQLYHWALKHKKKTFKWGKTRVMRCFYCILHLLHNLMEGKVFMIKNGMVERAVQRTGFESAQIMDECMEVQLACV